MFAINFMERHLFLSALSLILKLAVCVFMRHNAITSKGERFENVKDHSIKPFCYSTEESHMDLEERK